MDFTELIADFAKRHDIEGVAAEAEEAEVPSFGAGGFVQV